MSGVQAAIVRERVWLRGEGLDAAMSRMLATVADGPVYQLASDGRLIPFGSAVPTERLPEVEWRLLSETLSPVIPSPRIAAVQIPRVRLTLERTVQEQEAALLITDEASFRDWALSAPEVRLQGSRFAVSRSKYREPDDRSVLVPRVAVQGQPLPPLMGERYWLAGNIAIPLGFTWVPHVDVKTLETVLSRGLEESSHRILIWRLDGNVIEEIVSSDWVAVTRANVRATAAAS